MRAFSRRRRVWFTAHAQRQQRLRDRSVVNCALGGRQSLCTRYRAFLPTVLPAFVTVQRLLAIACRLPSFVRRSLNRAHLCTLGNKHPYCGATSRVPRAIVETGSSARRFHSKSFSPTFPALVNVPHSVVFVLHRHLFNHSHADPSQPLFGS